jgi:transmembrane sensor
MSEANKLIDELIIRFLQQDLTGEEHEILNAWINRSDNNRLLFDQLTDGDKVVKHLEKLYSYKEEEGWKKIQQQFPSLLSVPARSIKWWNTSIVRSLAIAASIILLLGVPAYFLLLKNSRQTNVATVPLKKQGFDVKAPQVNRAMVTLSDGRKVYLDSVSNGEVSIQNNIKLVKLANGQIAYQALSGETINEIEYNTLSNPRGSKVIDMTLSDGTRVWLNAGSSLTYPVAFIGNERSVSISGEAYFEVTHNAAKPFVVKKGAMTVSVLGTHFNVDAYEDEPKILVTLLEGSVNVSNDGVSGLLKPGQQAQVGEDLKVENNADLEEVMAWKNGRFVFNGTDLNDIMRHLARWYDLDITYKKQVKEKFFVEIGSNSNLSNVLKILEETGVVHFKIEGKEITVIP